MGLDVVGIGALSDFAKTVVNKIWPDADAKQKDDAQLAILALTQEYNLQQGQLDVDKVEAANPSVFVSGWRPFVGWIGGVGLGYAAIVEPVLRFITTVGYHYSGPYPVIDTTITMQVLFGLLGLGVLRTVDKRNGVATK